MTVSQWQAVSSVVSRLSSWDGFPKPLTRDILETKISDSVKKSSDSSQASNLLAEAVWILEGCIDTIREVEQQNTTAKALTSQLDAINDAKSAMGAEMDRQKEKYEMNMKKMALLIDKLTATIRQKDEYMSKGEAVDTN